MNLDEIKKIIQDFFQDNTITIVGSGLSLTEGIPSMSALSIELCAKVPAHLSTPADIEIWSKIAFDLSSGINLEQALHNTKPTPIIEEKIRKITAQYIGTADRKVLFDIVHNNKILRFSKYLDHFNLQKNRHVVITTNYDRLIEYACEARGIRINNLFTGNFLAQFDPEQSVSSSQVTILKPYGCLSWHIVDGVPYSIPQSFFDNSLIATPGINDSKNEYNMLFDAHRTNANSAIENAQRYIIIGYDFGDDYLEKHLVEQLKKDKPALILTHSLSDKMLELIYNCKNITAAYSKNSTDTVVVTHSGETIFSNLNLWDLNELLKEIF